MLKKHWRRFVGRQNQRNQKRGRATNAAQSAFDAIPANDNVQSYRGPHMTDDDINSREQYTTNGDGKQQYGAAEHLFDLFASDLPAHIETRDFSHTDEDGKHKFKKTETVFTALTIEHVEAHLAGTVRISAYPLQKNDTVRWGALDIDYTAQHRKPPSIAVTFASASMQSHCHYISSKPSRLDSHRTF
jgi:hypothetical protein